MRERFTEAVKIAEAAFAEELGSLVSHLAERLSGEADGKPKVFRDTAVTNLNEFLERFRRLSIGTDESLEQLVDQARSLVTGVVPEDLRQRESLRTRISIGPNTDRGKSRWLHDRPTTPEHHSEAGILSRVGETAELIIKLGGNVRMIYSELIEPHALLGRLPTLVRSWEFLFMTISLDDAPITCRELRQRMCDVFLVFLWPRHSQRVAFSFATATYSQHLVRRDPGQRSRDERAAFFHGPAYFSGILQRGAAGVGRHSHISSWHPSHGAT